MKHEEKIGLRKNPRDLLCKESNQGVSPDAYQTSCQKCSMRFAREES